MLTDLAQLFQQELNHYRKHNEDTLESLQFPTPPVTNFHHFLSTEIELANGPRGWQAILYSANAALDIIWRKLIEEDKQRFFTDSWSNAMALRVSISKENAVKLLNAVKSGQLSYQVGVKTVPMKFPLSTAPPMPKIMSSMSNVYTKILLWVRQTYYWPTDEGQPALRGLAWVEGALQTAQLMLAKLEAQLKA